MDSAPKRNSGYFIPLISKGRKKKQPYKNIAAINIKKNFPFSAFSISSPVSLFFIKAIIKTQKCQSKDKLNN